jgi:hypothetical protein
VGAVPRPVAGGLPPHLRPLGIAFDSYDGESSLNDKVQPVIARFLKAGVAHESLGAIVVDVSDVLGREIAPCMLQKSDGASTYAARDCAEAIDRWEKYRFGANVYVVSRQEDHFAQVFAALGKLAVAEKWPENWPVLCENVSFGFVRGMSTRKGEAVWLEAVLDEARDRAARYREERATANARAHPELPAGELAAISESVGQAALLYFDVSSRRLTDVSFDWDTVLQFEGNTGPYLQYTHARMSGIFRKAAEAGIATTAKPGDLQLLVADEEWALVQKLRSFSPAVRRAAEQREPFEVAHYLHELASVFNAFYNRHVVLDEADPARSRARLALVGSTRAVLASGLTARDPPPGVHVVAKAATAARRRRTRRRRSTGLPRGFAMAIVLLVCTGLVAWYFRGALDTGFGPSAGTKSPAREEAPAKPPAETPPAEATDRFEFYPNAADAEVGRPSSPGPSAPPVSMPGTYVVQAGRLLAEADSEGPPGLLGVVSESRPRTPTARHSTGCASARSTDELNLPAPAPPEWYRASSQW